MAKKELKTNAMRILEKKKIPFTYITYECEEFVDGYRLQISSDNRMSWCIKHL